MLVVFAPVGLSWFERRKCVRLGWARRADQGKAEGTVNR